MEFLELKDISERYMELVNPSTPEKVQTVGQMAGLRPGSRVIDFGCGFGEALVLWAERFGISGIGIDVRQHACERAQKKVVERGLAERIQIVCGNAADYPFERQTFDVAACIGATFIWGGFRPTLRRLKEAIQAGGRLVVGEPYWRRSQIPAEYGRGESAVHTEYELLCIARDEGFNLEYVVRASHDDWDRYESDNWRGLIAWLEENPDHPQRQEVIDHLHSSQEEYLRYAREFFGWAIYLLNPVR
jgi:SAM-dependent methyltransferase